ncbi:hypothetical protein [Nocardioides sp. Soil796]|uniref:hypothetical protein n=1 Tax=Nocardioides sp. Soil796 TaxID=1736412 RepID=UPI00070E9668|nr:hypothetical protein [Nocardioides sp. Soil796]KRF14169.1 hypothetical protein ASH02_07370 [Nocardioides sp. Soil796]
MSEQSEKPQWFIAADGTVLQTWPPGPDNDRLKYLRHDTNRRLELSDLYALDERLDDFQSTFARRSNVLLVVAGIAVVGVVVAWLVLPRVGVGTTVTLAVTAVCVLLFLGMGPLARAVSGGGRASLDQIYLDAGIVSSNPKVIKDHEALALIEAPGTVAGRKSG